MSRWAAQPPPSTARDGAVDGWSDRGAADRGSIRSLVRSGYEARLARLGDHLDAGAPGVGVLVGAESTGSFMHSPGDVSDEIEQLHGEIMQIGQELIEQLFRQEPELRGFDIPRPGVSEDLLAWRRTIWVPFVDQWLAWKGAHGDSFWQNLPLSGAWDRAQDFRQKLHQIRASAQRAGLAVRGPTPIAPRRDASTLDALGDLWRPVKVAAYVGLGVGAIFLVSAAVDRVRRVRRDGSPPR